MDPGHEQARRELIADLSHDLRTPLVAMRGYLELLVARGEAMPADERRQHAETALRQCRHLASLVDELFELARLDGKGMALDREPLALAELASDVVQKFALAAATRGVTLDVAAESGLPPVRADLRLIERVLENLVANALRHTPDGGRVELRLGRTPGAVQAEVSDNGSGIPADELPFVFDRHYRGAASRLSDPDGAGLGLAIARRIVELHGGTLRAESEPSRGTCLRFALPTTP
jgi:signal transduction histidine kinase